jgi:hypothetical protein
MKTVSLWLLPPPLIRDQLNLYHAKLAEEFGGIYPFEPHVTTVGRISCESPTDLADLATALSQELEGSWLIPCHFREQVLSMSNPDGTLVWNQACVSVMKRSEEFMSLIKRVRKKLKEMGMECGELEFPAPIGEPHLSHYYGTQNAPRAQEVTRCPDFTAVEAALWETSGGFEGVENWEEIPGARITLL